MRIKQSIFGKSGPGIILMALTVVICSGCSGDGPAIEAHPQTISFSAAPQLAPGGTATVAATASSGLAVSYSSTTPTVCSVNSSTGVVTGISGGTCIISANQSGNTHYAPALQVTQAIMFSGLPEITAPGTPNTPTDVINTYNVVATFYEPDTQPRNSIFIGSFTLNSTTGTVSNLHGILSESMTGGSFAYPNDTMTWLTLNNQLSSLPVTLGGVDGLLVTTFMLNATNTFSNNPVYGGTDGWSPGTGFGLYYGFPGVNPGNAYARIFVNTANPTAVLTQAQIDKLAYADCTPGGMMGGTCMTGTTVAGYGTLGSMSGYPVSQTITKQ
jgi:hypothetical protein